MRNPFKAYWFIQCERIGSNGVLISKHWRCFSTWIWAKPSHVITDVLQKIAEKEKCGLDDLIPTAITRN